MRRKIEYPEDCTLILESNNGGDVLEIIDEGDGKYTFQTGHNCVWNIRKSGTISEICMFLEDIAMTFQDTGMPTVEDW